MTVQYKTPGVYIEEIDAFPPSIVGVETAVPVFIGYTQTAEQNGRKVLMHPVRIGSMVEYARIFGHAFEPNVTLAESTATAPPADAKAQPADPKAQPPIGVKIGGKSFTLNIPKPLYLYNSLRLFYANGGGNCYVVSVGQYPDTDKDADVKLPDLKNGLDAVRDLVGPTMLVIPEASLLGAADFNTLANQMLTQCQEKQDRVAILDVFGVDKLAPESTSSDFTATIDSFRKGLSGSPSSALKYGMAYAPFLRTSIVDPSEFDYTSISNFDDKLKLALLEEANQLYPDPAPKPGDPAPALSTKAAQIKKDYFDEMEKLKPKSAPKDADAKAADAKAADAKAADAKAADAKAADAKAADAKAADAKAGDAKADDAKADDAKVADAKPADAKPAAEMTEATRLDNIMKINQGLMAQLPIVKEIYAAMAAKLGTLPPSGAMAGVYTRNDVLRGVWNAPANVGLVSVIGPTLNISTKMQDDLNMPIGGLAVNAIRDFVGRGTLVWGARTLDGNSNDWRYIQVRRALIYIEQSVELALNKFVFEPNVAQTWVNVTAMIGSFLRGVWSAGGLMGATPTEAFSVQCGLGSTMTAQDVLEGRMIVQIKLQMVRPAEFIVLTFQQQMQGGA